MKNALFHPLWNRIKNDWLRKLIALFFATLIFFAGRQRISEEQVWNNIPVEVIVPASLINTNPHPIEVRVTVRGSRRDLQRKRDLVARVKVRESRFISGQSYRLEVTPQDFNSDNGITVISVAPADRIHLLTLQRRITRNIPVRAVFAGKLSPEYQSKVQCIPSSVEVTGPEQTVRSISDLVTRAIPLDSGVTDSFSYTTELENPANLLFGVKNSTVEVRVTIERSVETRSFRDLPLQVLASPQSNLKRAVRELSASTVKVSVSGPKQKVLAMKENSLRPYVELPEKISGRVKIKLPVQCVSKIKDVVIRKIVPSEIELEISE